MRRCPHCGSEFPSRYKFCIRDGVALIEIAGHGPGDTASPSRRTGVARAQSGGSPQWELITPPPSGALINWLQTHKLMWISAVVLAVIAIMVIIARLPTGERRISKALQQGEELRADLLWSTSMKEGLPVWSIAFSPDSRFMAVAVGSEYSESGSAVMTISTKDGSLVKTFSKFSPYEYASWVAYSPDGRLLGVTTDSREMMIWKVADGSLVGRAQEERLRAELVSFSRGGLVAAVMRDLFSTAQAIGIFRVQDGELQRQRLIRVPVKWTDSFASFALSPDWTLTAAGTQDSIRLWQLESDQLALKWEVPLQACRNRGDDRKWCSVPNLTFSPDGSLLALSYDVVMERDEDLPLVQQNVAVIRTEDGTIAWTFTGESHKSSPDSPGSSPVAFSPSGGLMAAGNDVIRIWRATNGRLVLTLEMAGAYAIAFSPGGDRLAAGTLGSGEVRLWRLKVR